MPDQTTEQPVIQVPDELKQKLAEASGPIWKKVLWWLLGGILIALGAIGLMYIIKGQGPATAVKAAINDTKVSIDKSDMAARIKIAEAEKAEQQVIDKLKEIDNIQDERKRREELNKLL